MGTIDIENADRFLSAFNEIEQHCRRKLGNSQYEGMVNMLYQLQRDDAVIRNFMDDLKEFTELRNAIVHSRRQNEVIANPILRTVQEIEQIRDKIVNPPKIKSLFGKKVVTASVEDTLSNVLSLFDNYNISQVPVLNGKEVLEIVNGNTIVRWLAQQEIIAPADIRIADLLPFIELKKNYSILPEGTDVYSCADVYARSLHKGWYYDAVLMTSSGRNGEGLTGIIVLEDIARYLP